MGLDAGTIFLRRLLASSLLAPILALVVYAPVLSFGLLWDDPVILDKQLPALSIAGAFAPPAGLEQSSRYYYRPLSVLSFVLNRIVYRKDPFGYHATVWLLHAVAVLAVFQLGKRLMSAEAACLGAALFAVFPLGPECVAWIAGRTDVLMTLFCALAASVFAAQLVPEGHAGTHSPPSEPPPALRRKDRGKLLSSEATGTPKETARREERRVRRKSGGRTAAPGTHLPPSAERRSAADALHLGDGRSRAEQGQWKPLAACASLFLLALLSKESAVAFAPVLIGAGLAAGWRGRRLIAAALTALVPPLVYLFMRSSLGPTGTASPLSRLDLASSRAAFRALAFFLVRLVLPYPGSAYRLVPPQNPWILPLATAVLAGGLLLAWKSLREGRAGQMLLLLWIAAGVVLAASAAAFSLSRTPVADRYFYMPAAGWCLLLAGFIGGRPRAAETPKPSRTAPGHPRFAPQQVPDAHGPSQAAQATTQALSPDPAAAAEHGATGRGASAWVRLAAGWMLVAIFAVFTLGRSRIYANDFTFWSAAVAADPSAGSAHINLGSTLWERGDHEGARHAFERALGLPLAPADRALALTSLGAALNTLGRTAEAEKALREAASLPGADITATYNLASFLYRKGARSAQMQGGESTEGAGTGAAAGSQAAAGAGLQAAARAGAVLLEAREWLARSAAMAPGDARPWLLMGYCYQKEGRMDDAKKAWMRVLTLDGQSGPQGSEAAAALRELP